MRKDNVRSKLVFVRRKRGFILLLITFSFLVLTFVGVMGLYQQTFNEYYKIKLRSDYVQARYLAQSWLGFPAKFLGSQSEKDLYMFGLFDGPIPIPFSGRASIVVSVQDETGKINVNFLVNNFDDSINTAVREMLDRLSESLGLDYNKWDAVIDWIDENNIKMPFGYEERDYQLMSPPRKIKNSYMQSIDELLFIPGFDSWTLYADLRSEDEKQKYSEDFQTEDEKGLITDDDFRLAHNITAYMPNRVEPGDWKININAAPYHVILSLSEFMTPNIAKAVLLERRKNGGFFENLNDLDVVSQLHFPSVGNLTVLQEIQPKITFSGRLYKIIVDVSIASKTARVMGLYDTKAKKLIAYLE